MYFKGTPTRGVGEIAKETKASGGLLNAATIYDHTHYYAVLPAGGFEAGLAIQADAYAHSVIDAAELARELEVIIEEAKRKADNPSAVATETLFALLHDAHRIRRWRIGREAVLRGFTRDQVLAFYRNFYRPRNTVLAIVGDVDPGRAIAEVARHYGHLTDEPVVRTPGPAEPPPAGRGLRYQELDGDVQQSEVLVGWRTPPLAHSDSPALDVVATLLAAGRASRLYCAVRDRRLAAAISAWNYTPSELGVFAVHATARSERAASALRAAWDQVVRVCDGDVREPELERARRVTLAQWLRRLDTAEGQATISPRGSSPVDGSPAARTSIGCSPPTRARRQRSPASGSRATAPPCWSTGRPRSARSPTMRLPSRRSSPATGQNRLSRSRRLRRPPSSAAGRARGASNGAMAMSPCSAPAPAFP